jgi:hypothetical protein
MVGEEAREARAGHAAKRLAGLHFMHSSADVPTSLARTHPPTSLTAIENPMRSGGRNILFASHLSFETLSAIAPDIK